MLYASKWVNKWLKSGFFTYDRFFIACKDDKIDVCVIVVVTEFDVESDVGCLGGIVIA